MIKWLLKWLDGKPVPKYLSGKKRTPPNVILKSPNLFTARSQDALA